MLRGENIGTAYVRILADGTGLDRSIRDQFNDIDWDKNTRRTTSDLVEGFKNNLRDGANQRKLRSAIADPLARADWLSNDFFTSTNWRNFRSGLTKEYGEAGTRAGESLERGLFEGMDFEDLERHLNNMTPLLVKMQKEIDKEASAAKALAKSLNLDLDKVDDKSSAGVRKVIADFQNLKREFTDLDIKVKDFGNGLNVAKGRDRPFLLDRLREIETAFKDSGIADIQFTRHLADMRKEIVFAHPQLRRFNNGLDDFADKVGRAFGKGSRSEFLNVIGRMAEKFTQIPALFTRGAMAVQDWLTSMREANGILGTTGAALKPFAGIAAGLAGAFVLLGPLLSGLSMIAGVLVALSSTVILGLAGAVGAIAGALAPAIAGIGILVAGFMNAPPAAKHAVAEIKKSFSGLGKVAGKTIFANAAEDATRLRKVIGNLEPITRKLSVAVRDVGEGWLKMVESNAFNRFRRDMEKFLPDAIRRLGKATGELFGGLGGVLRALVAPHGVTDRFLHWLVDITERFNEWANSAKGQNSLQDFFDKAGDSAARLGEFLGAVWDLLGTLLTVGQDSGDTLFGNMTKAIRNFNDALNENGGKNLRKWFDDSVRFGNALGKLLVGFGKLFDTLDTEFSRTEITVVLDVLAGALQGVSDVLAPVAKAVAALGPNFLKLAGEIGIAVFAFAKLRAAQIAIAESALLMQASLGTSAGRIGALTSAARFAAGAGGLLLMADSAHRTSTSMGVLEGAAGGAMSGAALGSFAGPVGTAVGAALGGLAGGTIALARGTEKVKVAAKSVVPELQSYADSLDALTGATTRQTRAVALDNLQKQHAITTGHALGISTKTLINASLGYPAAMDKVRAAVAKANASLEGASFHFGKNGEVIADMTSEQRKAAKGANDLAAAIGFAAEASDKDIIATRDRMIQLGRYKKLLPGIPKNVVTKIDLLGLEKTRTNIVALQKKYHLTPPQIETILKAANVNPTKAQIQSIIDKAKEYDRQRPNPRFTADTAAAAARINALIAGIAKIKDKTVKVTVNTNANVAEAVNNAAGSIVSRETLIRAGEAGPEAIVPLNRPLSQVDPSVRWLSAIAQGKDVPGMARGGVVGGGKTINVGGMTVVSNGPDPETIAIETVNRLVAVGY